MVHLDRHICVSVSLSKTNKMCSSDFHVPSLHLWPTIFALVLACDCISSGCQSFWGLLERILAYDLQRFLLQRKRAPQMARKEPNQKAGWHFLSKPVKATQRRVNWRSSTFERGIEYHGKQRAAE